MGGDELILTRHQLSPLNYGTYMWTKKHTVPYCTLVARTTISLKGTLAKDFSVLVFCTDQTNIGQLIRLSSVFDFVLEFVALFEFFNLWR